MVAEFDSASLVSEIVALTGADRSNVERRLQMELAQLGWNVSRDAERFQISPHRFDEHMATLYREGDGFIYETLAFWMRPYRQAWTVLALDRIRRLNVANPRVLLLGDGSGSDALYLSRNGVSVDYCDFPGSRTFDFAVKRFDYHKATVNVMRDRAALEMGSYDAVLSFEVLEHLPDPMAELRSIAFYLRPGGIALITEAFSGVIPNLPTHLESNLRFVGRVPLMCADVGLRFTWHGPGWKPWEFVKQPTSKLRLCFDLRVLKSIIFYQYPKLWNVLHPRVS
jgi:SAM-dependent methyltransferase